MIFNEQPQSIVGCNSPIIYQVYDPLYSNDEFEYQCQVYVWSGGVSVPATPNWTINRKPDQYGNGRAWIDIHKLVQQEVTRDFLDNPTYIVGRSVSPSKFVVHTKLVAHGFTHRTPHPMLHWPRLVIPTHNKDSMWDTQPNMCSLIKHKLH